MAGELQRYYDRHHEEERERREKRESLRQFLSVISAAVDAHNKSKPKEVEAVNWQRDGF
tara:strand:- start:215 stop:391 length:177 start_codon:yes stop_codon:yes gene_type:complete